MLWLTITGIVVVSGILSYLFFIRPYKYWIDRGVIQGNPKPLFGHFMGTTFHTQSWTDLLQMIYNLSPNSR